MPENIVAIKTFTSKCTYVRKQLKKEGSCEKDTDIMHFKVRCHYSVCNFK